MTTLQFRNSLIVSQLPFYLIMLSYTSPSHYRVVVSGDESTWNQLVNSKSRSQPLGSSVKFVGTFVEGQNTTLHNHHRTVHHIVDYIMTSEVYRKLMKSLYERESLYNDELWASHFLLTSYQNALHNS